MKSRRSPRRGHRKSFVVLAEALEARRLFSANLVISEFEASNSNGITDSFGDHSDWIEIHNAGDADANLNDYFLTDNAATPEEWRFPVQTLAAGAYLKVFASGRDLAVAGSELHTNFKLSASGEYLGLINAADDSAQFAYAPTYPAQSPDVSYGLSDSNDPNSTRVFFTVPTPGAANNATVAEPTYSVAGGTFAAPPAGSPGLQVTLTDATPGATIHFTVDGTTPTASSATYTGTLNLTSTTMLRTVATATNYTSSPVSSQSYVALDATTSTSATLGSSNVSTFSSNLPIVMINTFSSASAISDATSISQTADTGAIVDFINTSNGTATALGTPSYDGRAGIHVRGSTSSGALYLKKQFSIELWDETNNGKNVALLGMPSESDWILYAPYTEKVMMQNALAYQLANAMGHYASRTQYVEVFLNTGNSTAVASGAAPGGTAPVTTGTTYVGVYILEEKIKIDANRVNVDEISPTNPNGGFIVAQDRNDTNTEQSFTDPQGVKIINVEPDIHSITSAESSTISTDWNAFVSNLFNGTTAAGQPWNTPGNDSYYGKYIDVKSFVDFYLENEMLRNIDSFWLSTYFNKAADTTVNGTTTRGLISAGPVWDFNLALGAADYNQSANSDGYDTDTLTPAPGAAGVSGFNPQDPYFQRLLTDANFKQAVADRWEQLRTNVFSNTSLLADMDANVAILSNGTTNYPVGPTPQQPATNPIVRNFIRWPELGVGITTEGLYDPNGNWIQEVNLAKNWLIGRVNWLDSQFIPPPTLTPGGNETGTTSVSMTPIGPAVKTDTQIIGPTAPMQYIVPTSSLPGWYLSGYTPSGWTTTTTAGIGYDRTTTPVDFTPYISTNLQTAMYQKRATVFTRTTFTLSDPSSIQALILKVRYDDGFIAWVNGVRVMDANSPENTISPVYTTVSGASGDDTQSILYREFDITSVKSLLVAGVNTLAIQGLNSGTGSDDFLLAPTLYSRAYTYPSAGQVYYTTDGTDPRTSMGTVSASAYLYSAAVALSSSTRVQARTLVNGVWSSLSSQLYDFDANRLRITELMYNPPALSGYSTQDLEYVELQNVSSTPLDLTGFDFTNGVTFNFPSTTLAPGAYGVVVKNPAAFAARYGSSINVLGTYTGSFDNSGETVALADSYGQTVESFKYLPTWYSATAGGGDSLVVVNPTGDTATLATAAGWRASYTADGAPGIADSDSVVPAVTSWVVNENGATGQPTVHLNFGSSVSVASPANLSAVNTVTNATVTGITHAFDGSSITFTFPAGTPSGDYLLTLPAAGVFNISGVTASSDQTLNLLLVRAGNAYVLPTISGGLTVGQLVMGVGASLDIGTNSVLISSPTSLAAIGALLATGYAGGTWTGTGGITSSVAAGNPSIYSVAYLSGANPANASLDSRLSNPTAVLLRPSLIGDFNIDGKVDRFDIRQFNARINFNDGLTTHDWADGDLTFDGTVDRFDIRAFNAGNNFNSGVTLAMPVTAAPSAAPITIAPPVVAAPAPAPPVVTPAPPAATVVAIPLPAARTAAVARPAVVAPKAVAAEVTKPRVSRWRRLARERLARALAKKNS